MPSRDYQIEAENILPDDFVPDQPLEAPGDDPGALAELMLKAASVLEMVGGAFSVAAIRKEIGPGLWVPDVYVAKWESYAPGGSIRRQQEGGVAQQQAAPEAAPAPEPAAPVTVEPVTELEPEPEAAVEPGDGHPSPDPGVDPTPPGSVGVDIAGDLLGDASDNVLAEVS